MRRGVLAVVAAVFLGACGSDDFGQNFVGTWNGILSEAVGAESFSFSQTVSITEPGKNSLTLGGVGSLPVFCSDGSGLPATATSATEFSGGTHACPPVQNGIACPGANSSQTTTFRGGSGTLTGSVLTVVLAGSDTCSDGRTINFTQTFTGSK